MSAQYKVINGRYRLGQILGRGSMGTVHEALDQQSERTVAIKLLHEPFESSSLGSTRFRREFELLSRLNDPGIVKVFDWGVDQEQRAYVVMERLQGHTATVQAAEEGFDLDRGLRVISAMLKPLAAAHSIGVVHRDIKPENVFLHRSEQGIEIKLIDFGIAKDQSQPGSGTATNAGLGTPYYMSPEQATSAKSVTPAADVWSVGVMLYQLVYGALPFQEDTAFNTLIAVVQQEPARRAPDPQAPKELLELIDACLSKDPAARPADASELLAALLASLGLAAPVAAPVRPSRRFAVAVALALLLTGALGAGAIWQARRPAPEVVAVEAPSPRRVEAAASPAPSTSPESGKLDESSELGSKRAASSRKRRNRRRRPKRARPRKPEKSAAPVQAKVKETPAERPMEASKPAPMEEMPSPKPSELMEPPAASTSVTKAAPMPAPSKKPEPLDKPTRSESAPSAEAPEKAKEPKKPPQEQPFVTF